MLNHIFSTKSMFLGIVGLSTLTSAALLYSQSIRLDESQSIWMASKSVSGLLRLVGEEFHVPLYTLILHFWMQLFGTNILVVRLLSLIFFFLTLPVLYQMVKEASNTKVALLSIVLFSLSPFIMWYSFEARMYSLFTFSVALNHLYFLRFLKSGGLKWKTQYFLSCVLGFYSHYFFIFLLFSQALFVINFYLKKLAADKSGLTLKNLLLKYASFPLTYFGLIFGAFLLLVPWLYHLALLGFAANTQPLIPNPTSFNILQTLVYFIFGFQDTPIQSFLVSLWPLSIVILFFVFTQRKKIKSSNMEYFVFVTFLPILLVFLISMIRPIFLSRYLILVTPTLFFIIAWVLFNYTIKLSSFLIVGFTIILFSLLVYQNVSAYTPVKEDYKGVVAYLNARATPSDVIAVSVPFTIYPIEYSYTGTTKIATIPLWDRYAQGPIPKFSEEGLKKQLEAYKKQYNYIYLVLSYDQGYEKEVVTYFDQNYERVDLQTFSPGLQVREHKLRY